MGYKLIEGVNIRRPYRAPYNRQSSKAESMQQIEMGELEATIEKTEVKHLQEQYPIQTPYNNPEEK